MAAIKVKRGSEYHCFYCNARVEVSAAACPQCGREFVEPEKDASPASERPLVERMKVQAGWRWAGRGYVRAVVILALLGAVLLLVWPARRQGPKLARPQTARPEFRLLETREMPLKGLDRLTLILLARPGMEQDSLRAVLDWALFDALDRHNRQDRRNVRVVWLYVLGDANQPASRWRAMAIWYDPKLPRAAWPAGNGGDAIQVGTVEYDFTNPLATTGQRSERAR